MARQVKDARLETRESRLRLKVSNEPYWRLICTGFYLGYRKGARGGTWILRQKKNGVKQYVKRTLGIVDDTLDSNSDDILSFREAQLKAHALIDTLLNEHHKATVADAVNHYMKWFKDNRKSAKETQTTINAHILPHFGHKLITELTTKEIKSWHQKLATNAARKRSSRFTGQQYSRIAETENEKRSRRSTANRILTVLKAILNKAFQDEMIDDDLPWRRVKPFEKVDEPKIRFLTESEAKNLIDACDPYLQKLVQAALYTGARYNELSSLRVADVQLEVNSSIFIQPSKSGKGRHVPLNEAGDAFFRHILTGKLGSEHVFTKQDNTRWGKNHHVRLLKEACLRAKIEPAINFHELRHTYASLLAQAGVDLLSISKLLGHADTRVTSRHYAHLCDKTLSEKINLHLPNFAGIKKYEMELI
ncbi:MAG: site-specific integrase [Proteobacteria bacterium]|nr:site-specific integrase [Pseudomonadota bacterium]